MATNTYDVDVGGKTYEVDAPDPNTAWKWANQFHEEAVAGLKARSDQEVEATRQRIDQGERERPLAERVWTNVLAGAHTLGQGVAGIPRLFGADIGPTKEDVAEHKRIKEQLASQTKGGEYIQMGAEIAPTLAVPAGWGGMALRAGSRALPRALGWTQNVLGPRLGNVANVAASGGLTAAATTPGDWSDRAASGLMAAGAGAAAPGAVALGQAARRIVTPAGRQTKAAERFIEELGPERAQQLVEAGQQAGPNRFTQAGVHRPTVAQLTEDPVLRQLETGLRVKQGPSFAAGDEIAAQGRANRMSQIAGTPEDLAAAEGRRAAATAPMRESALDMADFPRQRQAALGQAMESPGFERPVLDAVRDIATGESRPNPGVQTLVRYVMGELEQGVTPGQLYTIRKTLTTGVPHGTELGSAITQSRAERMRLVAAIDDALNAATDGGWGQYMRRFEQMSQPVTSMRAGQKIQDNFVGAARTQEGDPIYTASKLRQSLAKHGQKTFGSRTIPRVTEGERSTVNAIADSIESSDRARKAQATIGSATAENLQAADRATLMGTLTQGLAGMIPGIKQGSQAFTRWQQRNYEQALADLVQDPERLAQFLQAAQQSSALERGARGLARGGQAAPTLMGIR